ncbi:MAG: DUF1566 domain-containing protein [Desulfobacterales bacterium]|nr:DUF1566 domain-containing protein [Desulfobacterales bacterium]
MKDKKVRRLVAKVFSLIIVLFSIGACSRSGTSEQSKNNLPDISSFPVVDTGQVKYFNNTREITSPSAGEAFFGQDSHFAGNQQSFTDNGDGTITDNVTGLMWQKSFSQVEWADAPGAAAASTTGGHTDWRVPTIKELYSLINFSGNQGSGEPTSTIPPSDAVPFIDTNYFDFEYGQVNRYIDAQYVTSTEYVGTVMDGIKAFFGVNFADGRIKGYPQGGNMSNSSYYAIYVRGNTEYGINNFVDNGGGTITDNATGLMWLKYDSGDDQFINLLSNYTHTDGSLNWEEALDFAENLSFAGHDDWRLPNAKELQCIVDYARAPDVTNSPAIDPVFNTSEIINEAGNKDYPFFWSSTTFEPGSDAIIVQFGRSLGYMNGEFMDVHGAGGQRTDLKAGEPDYGHGPQGDVRRVYNYVRLVRGFSN